MTEKVQEIARLSVVLEEIRKLTNEIGPKLIRISHLKKEAKDIFDSLEKPEEENGNQ